MWHHKIIWVLYCFLLHSALNLENTLFFLKRNQPSKRLLRVGVTWIVIKKLFFFFGDSNILQATAFSLYPVNKLHAYLAERSRHWRRGKQHMELCWRTTVRKQNKNREQSLEGWRSVTIAGPCGFERPHSWAKYTGPRSLFPPLPLSLNSRERNKKIQCSHSPGQILTRPEFHGSMPIPSLQIPWLEDLLLVTQNIFVSSEPFLCFPFILYSLGQISVKPYPFAWLPSLFAGKQFYFLCKWRFYFNFLLSHFCYGGIFGLVVYF